MEDESLDTGTNIAGVVQLLNFEKIVNNADIDNIERKVKNMFIDTVDEEEIEEAANEEEYDIIQECEQAMAEVGSVNNDNVSESGQSVAASVKSAVQQPTYQSQFVPDPQDQYYSQTTKDEYLQSSISKVMEDVPKMNINMDQEIEDERKNFLLEQIESLKDDLCELGIKTDGYQYEVSMSDPVKRIDDVHKRLTFKYNKLKYNSIAEEALVASASLLEMIFNGKHEYFGVKPDITGYSDVVKSKLKRVRFETSTAVSKFVAKNNVGLLPRLAMELIPSLITQSQRRRVQAGDSLNANVSEHKKNSIRSHLSDLNAILPG